MIVATILPYRIVASPLFISNRNQRASVEAAYNRLHETFGEEEFKRFDKFVNEKVAPQVKALTPSDFTRPNGKPKSRITK
jgi:hypothetical protein